jgi:hypothetical protein
MKINHSDSTLCKIYTAKIINDYANNRKIDKTILEFFSKIIEPELFVEKFSLEDEPALPEDPYTKLNLRNQKQEILDIVNQTLDSIKKIYGRSLGESPRATNLANTYMAFTNTLKQKLNTSIPNILKSAIDQVQKASNEDRDLTIHDIQLSDDQKILVQLLSAEERQKVIKDTRLLNQLTKNLFALPQKAYKFLQRVHFNPPINSFVSFFLQSNKLIQEFFMTLNINELSNFISKNGLERKHLFDAYVKLTPNQRKQYASATDKIDFLDNLTPETEQETQPAAKAPTPSGAAPTTAASTTPSTPAAAPATVVNKAPLQTTVANQKPNFGAFSVHTGQFNSSYNPMKKGFTQFVERKNQISFYENAASVFLRYGKNPEKVVNEFVEYLESIDDYEMLLNEAESTIMNPKGGDTTPSEPAKTGFQFGREALFGKIDLQKTRFTDIGTQILKNIENAFKQKEKQLPTRKLYFIKQIFAKVLAATKEQLRKDMQATIGELEGKAIGSTDKKYEETLKGNLQKNFNYVLRQLGKDPNEFLDQISTNLANNQEHKNYNLINNLYREMNNELFTHNKNIIKEFLKSQGQNINLEKVIQDLKASRFKGLRDIIQYVSTASVAGFLGAKQYAIENGPYVYEKSKEIISWLWDKIKKIASKVKMSAKDLWKGVLDKDNRILNLIDMYKEMFASIEVSRESEFRKSIQGEPTSSAAATTEPKKSMFSGWGDWFSSKLSRKKKEPSVPSKKPAKEKSIPAETPARKSMFGRFGDWLSKKREKRQEPELGKLDPTGYKISSTLDEFDDL